SPGAGLVEFCTTSPHLAEDIRGLLLRLGARSRMVRRARTTGVVSYLVSVRDPASLARLQDELRPRHSRRRGALASLNVQRAHAVHDILPEMGQPLRHARLAAGMTRMEAAAALGLSQRTLEAYETGARPLTRPAAHRMSEDGRFANVVQAVAAQPLYWDRV